MSAFTIEIGTVKLHLQSAEDMRAGLGWLGESLTNGEMADLAAVSERTVRRWRANPAFPRPVSKHVTRQAFLQFLFAVHPLKARAISGQKRKI